MGISGWLAAKCKECSCRFNWYIDDSWPFVDSEIVGTCDNCFEHKSHDCVDEYQESEGGGFVIVGRKEFSPAESGMGKADSESDLGKSKISLSCIQPESSVRGTLESSVKPNPTTLHDDFIKTNEDSGRWVKYQFEVGGRKQMFIPEWVYEELKTELFKRIDKAAVRAVLEKELPCEYKHLRQFSEGVDIDCLVYSPRHEQAWCPHCRARKAIEDGLERMEK